MESKWMQEKDNLERLINVENRSYREIGNMYGCSDSFIRKIAKQLGIQLPQRRKVNSNEHFNRGTGKKYYCLNCGKELHHTGRSYHKFCDNKCQMEYKYEQFIESWKQGDENGIVGACSTSVHIRKYMFKKYNNKCSICGWGEQNPYTHTIPLELHHIDGDCLNNKESNLQLLCPNCHSLTENFGSRNKESKRFHRQKLTKAQLE